MQHEHVDFIVYQNRDALGDIPATTEPSATMYATVDGDFDMGFLNMKRYLFCHHITPVNCAQIFRSR